MNIEPQVFSDSEIRVLYALARFAADDEDNKNIFMMDFEIDEEDLKDIRYKLRTENTNRNYLKFDDERS